MLSNSITMNTQDIAKFAVRALSVPATEKKTFPIVGTRAWTADEIISLCERLSGKSAKIARMPLGVLRAMRSLLGFFQWGWNVADRLAFTEVIARGKILDALMAEVYETFGLKVEDTTTLEDYLKEYFSRIMKKLKEIEFEKNKAKSKAKAKRKSVSK